MSTIALTTDFGWQDWYAGAMKGVILDIHPKARVIDLTHGIPAGNILAGALALASSFRFFPKGTIHLAVVDPGVGGERGAIAVATKDYFFVGPDNGVLSLALARERPQTICRLENRRYRLKKVSRTFHGRDVFAPAAAYLSKGVDLAKLGPEQADYEHAGFPWPAEERDCCQGEVIYIDHFGNAITNLPQELLIFDPPQAVRVWIKKSRRPLGLVQFYDAAPRGSALALFGSTGFLEIAVNCGHAAQALQLRVGDGVRVDLKPKGRSG